jgi:hypothetical protein
VISSVEAVHCRQTARPGYGMLGEGVCGLTHPGRPGTAVARLSWMLVRQGEGYLDRALKRRAVCRRNDDVFSEGDPLVGMGAR